MTLTSVSHAYSKWLPATCCSVSYSNTRQSFNPVYYSFSGERAIYYQHSWQRLTSNVKNCSPSHGGRFESTSIGCYGNPKYPEDIGLASNIGSDSLAKTAVGGGAVKLSVTGACVIDGEISVDGAKSNASAPLAAGAAGSILIEASSVTGSGVIHADGVYCGNTSQLNGAGGRVALITETPVDTATLTIRAGGDSTGKYAPEGTVYLKDGTMTHGVLYLNNPLNMASGSTPNRGAYVVSAHKSLDPAAGAGFLAARRPRVACGCL